MTAITTVLFYFAWLASPVDVEVASLDGSSASGKLTAIDAQSVALSNEDDEVSTLAQSALMSVKLTESSVQRKPADDLVVQLANGSLLRCRNLESKNRVVTMTSQSAGELSVPRSEVDSIRFTPLDRSIASAWEEMQQKNIRNDIIVVRKGDVLDFLAGVVGDITESSISFSAR